MSTSSPLTRTLCGAGAATRQLAICGQLHPPFSAERSQPSECAWAQPPRLCGRAPLATYDNAGHRLTKTNYQNSSVEQYAYDPLYQLTQVTRNGSVAESYSYDKVGNRLSSATVATYSYNSSNQLTSSSDGLSYTYDNNGNTATKTDTSGTTQYSWDYENRLTSVNLAGGGTVTFNYDPFGRRIQKSGPSGTTNYVYDGANVAAEVDNTGAAIAHYAQDLGIDEPLAMQSSGALSFYSADGLGSITSLTTSSGALAGTFRYDAFGNLASSTGTIVNPYRYTGREYDGESGLYYYRARYYSPEVGRFISEDPIEFVSNVNFYKYSRNNPILFGDPLGLSDILITINRNTTTQLSTLGTLTVSVDGNIEFQGYSLEPPGTGGSNRLGTGSYDASVYQSPRLDGQDVLLLHHTDPMTFVEIHPGNFPRDTHGCILPGTNHRQNYVGNSRAAFNTIMNIVNSTQVSDQQNGEQTTITVTIQ